MKKIFVLVASLFLCTLFANAQNNVIDNELQKILNQKGNDYIDVNIMLKAQMTSDDFAVLNCKSDSKEVRREIVTNELKKFAENSQKDIMSVLQAEERSMKVTDIQNFWIANFINCKAKADVIYQLASHPDVATISYNNVMEVVSDSKETESRDTRAVTATIGEHLKQIKADQVWDLGYTGKGVIVAVLDSGVNTEHADIKDHLWNGNPQHGYNVVDPGQNPYDDRSHGTHCAGIVCGDGTSGMMTGVAPDATLMSIKVYADGLGGGLTVPRLVTGVQFAAEHGAHILNISQGWLGATDANRNTLRSAFETLLAQNIVTVVAAGNDREDIATYPVPGNIRTPGDCPPPWLHPDQTTKGGVSSVVSVGAVGDDNNIVAISSQGPVEWYDYPYNPGMGLIRPDIVAPATIRSLSNTSNDGYVTKGGTSQATPCVAGVMALMLEKNPNLTPEDLCKIVERTATQKTPTKDNLYGSGVVDALEAVRAVPLDVNGPALNVYDFTRTFNAASNLNFELTLINNGKTSTNDNTTVTISENDTYTTIVNNSATYGTMGVMDLEEAHSSEFIDDVTESATFVVSFSKETPDNHKVTFTVTAGSRTFDIVVTVYNELIAPTLNATANGTDINLSWNATNNAISYNIYRDGVFLENTTETSYTDADLEYGTIYAYTVTTKRGELESEHSLIARAQTADNPAKPSPTNVVATNNDTNVSVTWTNGAESKGSNIYRKDVTTSVETSIATNVNGTSYTDNTWNSLEGIYQYGVANLYAANENIYEEDFSNLSVTNSTNTYPTTDTYWYIYREGSNNSYNWKIDSDITNYDKTYESFSGKAAFITSNVTSSSYLSYLVTRPMTYNEAVKLSFKYITPAWGNDINTLKVMVSRDTHTGTWEELWSSQKTDVQGWPEAVVDLSAYVGQQIYIAFVNVAGYGYCTGVDEVSIFTEGSSESRIEWSDIVSKNVNMFVQDGKWSNTDNWTAKRLPNENEKVIIDANATIESGNITVNSLVINEGKSLTINDGVVLTVNGDFANTDADAFIINDGAQVFQSNDDVSATFVMNINNPTDWSTSNTEGWQFIASPLKYSKISDFVPSSSDYDLYKYDGTKDLEWLNHKDETSYEAPTAPQSLLAEATSTSTIRLSWAPVVGATSYNVYFDDDNFISTPNTPYEITGLMPGTEYCYTVTAVNAYGESEKPSAVCTKTITLAPQNLVANMASHTSIVLSWNTVAGTELYYVYKDNEKIASVTSLSYTVNNLNPATEYCFTVTSVGSEFLGIESAKSTPACATTDITIPTVPQNVLVEATSPYSVTLTWDAVATAESYNIYLFNGTEVANEIKDTEYIFNGLTPGVTYCYAVAAVNAKGVSEKSYSNEVKTPLPTPEAPQLTATDVGSAVELTWNATAYATTYKVYDEEGLVDERISSTTYTVYDLEAGQHCFTVIAVNAEGSESGASNTACATVTEQEQGPIVENVIIGDGNSTSIALPIYSNCAYSISQQIYTRAEIGQTGRIKAVSFKYKSGLSEPCTRTVKVYLQQTTKAFFTSGTDWVSMTNADLVYDGEITINNFADEWVRVKLNTPFEYTGNNLVVCVYDYTGKADSEITFAADQINELKGMYYYSTMFPNPLDPSNVNKTGYYSPTKRNQIRFSFVTGNEPGIPAAPANLIASCSQEMPDIDVYANAITLTWDADATAETYHIYDEGGNKIGQTGGTTFTIEGLECAKRYCYSVSAENETGEGATAEVCATTITEVPQNVVARSTDMTTINMSWDLVETATSYKVYLSDLLVGTTTTRSFDITGLTTGDYYCYSVTAVNEGGESKKSALGCAEVGDIQFEMCNLIFTLRDSWGDGWDPGTKLIVSYGTSSIEFKMPYTTSTQVKYYETTETLEIQKGTEVTVTFVGTYSLNEISFDIKCENGTVLASAAKGTLANGDIFPFTADCTPKAPNAPVLEANATSSTEIALSWNKVTTATRYNVYQDGNKVTTVTTTSYNVTGLTANTEYCFTVTAVNETDESDASEEVCEKTLLATPTNLFAEANGENSIILTWNAVAGATRYKIYSGETVIATVTETTYTKELLIAGTEYCYAVSAVNNDSESAKTAPACATTDEAEVEEGNLCTIIFTLKDQYNDSWDGSYLLVSYNGVSEQLGCPSGESPKTYELEIPHNALVTVTFNKGTAYYTYPSENSFTIAYESGKEIYSLNSMANGCNYEFRADCTPTVPENPTVTASANSESAITLTMSALGADSYTIYQNGILVAEGITRTTYTVEGLTANTEYCFTVVAVNEVGLSESVEACAKTKATDLQSVTVQIGEGTSYTTSYAPIYDNYTRHSISQMIYTEEEIGISNGFISSISFNQSSGNNNTRNIAIYLKNTNKEYFTTESSTWESLTSDLCVYDGNFTFGTAGWVTIKLQKEFSYNGGNLLICVVDKTGSAVYSNYDTFYTYETGQTETDTRAIYASNYSSAIDPLNVGGFVANRVRTGLGSDVYSYRAPQIKLSLEISASKSSSAPAAKMTDIKGGFEKVSAFGTSSGTELSKFETTFEQGVGYLASYETETVATFKGILNHETSFEFALDYDNGKDLANYHLLGNPFSFNMNWANTTANDLVNGYAVVNEQGGYNYLTNGEIKVGDGFFVKAKGSNPTLTYNTRSRNNEKQNFINVIASGKAGNDNVIINLAGEQEGFPKIKNFNEDIAVVYVYDNSTPYGIYNCESDVQEVELVFKANTFGEYNFHVETEGMFESITLFDKLTEAETNMLTGSYTFTTTPKENGNRFVLKFAKGKGSNEDDKFAFLSGNELIIEAEGVVQIVDVMGRVVYSNEVTSDNNRIDTSKFNTAAYIVRLITNDGIKTQKIVVY